MNPRFEKAVERAIEFLEDAGASKGHWGGTMEPSELLYVYYLSIKMEFDDHPFCPSKYIIDARSLDRLCESADHDRGAFDLLIRIVATKLLRNDPLSQQVSSFAGMVLEGKKKAPPSEGKRLAKQFSANVDIVFLAYKLSSDYGLDLTRNDASSIQESTCDAISKALEALGNSRTPRAIKELLVHKSAERVRDVVRELRELSTWK